MKIYSGLLMQRSRKKFKVEGMEMNRKKICFVTTKSITITSYILGQLHYLTKHCYDVIVISDNDADVKRVLGKKINYLPVKMKREIDFTHTPKCIFTLYRVFRKDKYRIVQYSTPNAAFSTSIAAWLARVPVRLYCQWGIRYVGFTVFKRRIFKLLEKLICTLSTNIQPDSKGNLLFSHKEGLYSNKKSSVIWNGSANGVDLVKFDIAKKPEWRKIIRSKYKLSLYDLVLGFVGRLDKDKGIDELLEAFKITSNIYPNIKLLIIGPGDKNDGLNQKLLEWSRSSKSIIYTGFTNKVEKYISTLDVLVQPSYREGFGSVVIEAEAMGVPVIVTDIPGPTDAMKIDVTGLVVPKATVLPLVNAIEYMNLNPENRKEMSKNSIEFAQKNFDQAKLLNFILEDKNRLYKEKINA